MKDRPITFTGPMVRAILGDRKTQTRRVIKPQPVWIRDPNTPFKTPDANPRGIIKCPYGQPGGRLWVREKWFPMRLDYRGLLTVAPILYAADGHIRHRSLWKIDYRDNKPPMGHIWRSPVHMSRWASRISLEITNVRVERVQDINVDDAIEEGIPLGSHGWFDDGSMMDERDLFAALWDSINAKKGFRWEANPWVWVVEFKRL
jgi:hypothetical protein